MRILVACERSGVVREAFRARGHDAYSCDLEPAEDGSEFHIVGDALWFAENDEAWDLMIAHPPCTYLANSSVHMLTEKPGKYNRAAETLIGPARVAAMEKAAQFFYMLLTVAVPHVCIENPIAHRYATAKTGRHSQIIQPYQFGEDASKATCLWLRNLPPLRPTLRVYGRIVDGRERWANQTDSGQNRLPPGPMRAMDRARTYRGIAEAMAEQWGCIR